jgi:hypothetical protein
VSGASSVSASYICAFMFLCVAENQFATSEKDFLNVFMITAYQITSNIKIIPSVLRIVRLMVFILIYGKNIHLLAKTVVSHRTSQ